MKKQCTDDGHARNVPAAKNRTTVCISLKRLSIFRVVSRNVIENDQNLWKKKRKKKKNHHVEIVDELVSDVDNFSRFYNTLNARFAFYDFDTPYDVWFSESVTEFENVWTE